MDYKVITSNKADKLQERVNPLLKKGYELVGPAQPVITSKGAILVQTLIKK